MQAHLLELAAAAEPGHVAFDHQQGEALVAGFGVGAGDDDDEVGVDPRGDEGLGAVEDPVVPVAHRRGADAGQIAARPRLGHRDRDHRLTTGDAGQPALLLLVVGQILEVRADDVVVQAQRRRGHAGHGDLLVDDRVEPEVVGAAAAVLLGHVEPDEPVLARGHIGRPVDDALGLPPLGVGGQLGLDVAANGVAERLVLGVVDRALHVRSLTSLSRQADASARKPADLPWRPRWRIPSPLPASCATTRVRRRRPPARRHRPRRACWPARPAGRSR